MKTNWTVALIVAIAFVAGIGVSGCSKAEPAPGLSGLKIYTCPMHPEVIKDAPGDCPKCGMKLVEKK